MTDQIQVQMFNWGPCVVKVKITDEFKKLLLTEARKNKLDYTDKLAGIVTGKHLYLYLICHSKLIAFLYSKKLITLSLNFILSLWL